MTSDQSNPLRRWLVRLWNGAPAEPYALNQPRKAFWRSIVLWIGASGFGITALGPLFYFAGLVELWRAIAVPLSLIALMIGMLVVLCWILILLVSTFTWWSNAKLPAPLRREQE